VVSTSVRTFLPVVGEADGLVAAFEGDPSAWLPEGRREGPDRWAFTVRAGAFHRPVSALIGHPWRAGQTLWRTVSWDPLPGDREPISLDRFLPSLDGELGLHLEADGGGGTLVLDARYRPPGGMVGAAVDAVALHRVARHTADRFLEHVAAGLSAETVLQA
jgi:hypothetical protein